MKFRKLDNKHFISAIFAILAAIFYAINIPFSKLLMNNIEPVFLAGFLYLGAGVGVAFLSIINRNKNNHYEKLTKKDLPFVVGMVVLDIMAPIFLLFGVSLGKAGNASLLGNFEIVATTFFAFFIFKEKVSIKLWIAILLITISSFVLSVDFNSEITKLTLSSFSFSPAALLVLAATICWGVENNCTRMISSKSAYQIVTIKGICSGLGSIIISFIIGEAFPNLKYIGFAMILGFVSYGLSIFFYVRSQNTLGAAKTSAYYAVAPFIGGLFSFIVLKEIPSLNFYIALLIMIIGVTLVIIDTIKSQKPIYHIHTITHTHDGTTHTHQFIHDHHHNEELINEYCNHSHPIEDLEKEISEE